MDTVTGSSSPKAVSTSPHEGFKLTDVSSDFKFPILSLLSVSIDFSVSFLTFVISFLLIFFFYCLFADL